MNIGPGLGVLGVDDFFMTDEGWQGLTDPVEQFGYTWESDIPWPGIIHGMVLSLPANILR
jgi:hypothetical protein